MYVHNYQIHNVLNVYRKQLSKKIGPNDTQSHKKKAVKEQVNISNIRQRQSIIEKVSADIVDKIARKGAENRFEQARHQYINRPGGENSNPAKAEDNEFTYSVIDENNRKKINVLPISKFVPWVTPDSSETHETD